MLEVRDIEVRYRNGALGVKNVSLVVEQGQVVALFGANGAGKTTTVRATSGFVRSEGAKLTRGSIVWNGTDMTNAEPHVFARVGVAVVPERKKVFPKLTVRENLSSMGSAVTGRAHAQRLTHVLELFPAIATRLDEAAGRLSGGEQQMLAIGRALLRDPKVLIIDEMTLGLHPSIHVILFDAVRRIVEAGTSILLVDESMAFALKLADHCYVIRSGEIVDSGPAERFRADHERAMANVF